MIPFYTRFPELAARETRCIHQILPGGPLPVGQYGFVEYFCDEENCDCRRVTILVTTPQAPTTPLAVISYGWESPEFYEQWMKGDAKAARDCTDCILDPLFPQSKYADHLLSVFRTIVEGDPAYVDRLVRHYEMFKRAPGYQASTKPAGPQPGVLREIPATPKIPRNDPCPCGSGKKFKRCCGQ